MLDNNYWRYHIKFLYHDEALYSLASLNVTDINWTYLKPLNFSAFFCELGIKNQFEFVIQFKELAVYLCFYNCS